MNTPFSDARARLAAMFTFPTDAHEADFTARVDAVVAAETTALQARIAELEEQPVDEAAELAEGQAGLEDIRREHPAPCRVPDSPDCTCPTAEPGNAETSTYQSRVLPPRNMVCSCSHTGLDHHHAGTKCWAHLPRTRQPNGTLSAVLICDCAEFKAAP